MNRDIEGAPPIQDIERNSQGDFLPEMEEALAKNLKIDTKSMSKIWDALLMDDDMEQKVQNHNDKVDQFLANSKESGKLIFSDHDALIKETEELKKELQKT